MTVLIQAKSRVWWVCPAWPAHAHVLPLIQEETRGRGGTSQVQAVLDLFNVEGSYLRERLTQRAAVYERVRRRCSALLEHFYGSSAPAQ